MTFVAKVDLLRRFRGLSERALAAELGIDPSAISRWRSRNSIPRHAMVKKIADLFGTTADVLVDHNLELPSSVLMRDLSSAASAAKKLFPRNQSAGQMAFERIVGEKMAKREAAETADFLRARAKALKQEAAALEKRAAELDAK